ncbi:uncharacterized [Tachysurus ichikawai]
MLSLGAISPLRQPSDKTNDRAETTSDPCLSSPSFPSFLFSLTVDILHSSGHYLTPYPLSILLSISFSSNFTSPNLFIYRSVAQEKHPEVYTNFSSI